MIRSSPSGYTSTTARSSRAFRARMSPSPGISAPTNIAPFGYRAGRSVMPSSIAASNRSDASTLPGLRGSFAKAAIGRSRLTVGNERRTHLVPHCVSASVPAGGFLRRRQLLRLAEQTPGSPLLYTPSLVMSHADKIQHLARAADSAHQHPNCLRCPKTVSGITRDIKNAPGRIRTCDPRIRSGSFAAVFGLDWWDSVGLDGCQGGQICRVGDGLGTEGLKYEGRDGRLCPPDGQDDLRQVPRWEHPRAERPVGHRPR
jgi:hypothetical protein